MKFMAGRIREWIILGVCLAVGAVLLAWARSAAEEAYEAREDRQEALDSVRVLEQLLEERTELIPIQIDSINLFWQAKLDSIGELPPPTPPLPPEVRTFLDTVEVLAEVRVAIDQLSARNDLLEEENAELRRINLDLRTTATLIADSVTEHWLAIRAEDLKVIEQQKVTIEAAIHEAKQFEEAYLAQRLSFLDKLIWAGVGFAGGYLTAELLGNDDQVYIHSVQRGRSYREVELTRSVDPVFACANWGPRPIPFC